MASITLRSGKGSPLTHDEVDDNFTNINNELSDYLPLVGGTVTGSIAVTGTVDGRDVSVDGTKLDTIAEDANNYTLPTSTSAVLGGIEIFSDTVQSVSASAVSSTASRTYGLQLNSENQAVINVPWEDTTTTSNVVAALTAGDDITISAGGVIAGDYSVGDGGLTQKNFTTALNTKLDNSVVSENAASSAVMQAAKIQTLTALEYLVRSFNTLLDSDTIYLVSE